MDIRRVGAPMGGLKVKSLRSKNSQKDLIERRLENPDRNGLLTQTKLGSFSKISK
jgi:hypothetical protein